MTRRGIILITVATVAAGAAITGVLLANNGSESDDGKKTAQTTHMIEYSHPDTGFTFEHPADKLEPAQISQKDQKEHIFFRGQQKTLEAASFMVTVRYESGLRQVAALSKMATIDVVRSGAEKSLPNRFPEYKELSNRKTKHRDYETVIMEYTYVGPTGDVIRQVLYMIAKDDDTVVYMTAQAKQSDFDTLQKEIFEPIFQSSKYE